MAFEAVEAAFEDILGGWVWSWLVGVCNSVDAWVSRRCSVMSEDSRSNFMSAGRSLPDEF